MSDNASVWPAWRLSRKEAAVLPGASVVVVVVVVGLVAF
jgi:hypothetical protein